VVLISAESRILKERAFAIENAVFTSVNGSTGNDYRASQSITTLGDHELTCRNPISIPEFEGQRKSSIEK
jgi:hypothetical protein